MSRNIGDHVEVLCESTVAKRQRKTSAGMGPILGYIDPTGGLPPSIWGAILALLIAAAGLAAVALRVYARWALRHVWLIAVATALIMCAAMAWIFSRHEASPAPGSSPRVVILCMDGLDPGLLQRYMGEGRLPNFSRLAARGVFHPLGTTTPPQSPVAWASFITGASPAEHGLFDFIKRDPATYAPDLSTSDRHGVARPWSGAPFWEDKAFRSAQVIALRIPLTFPPPKVGGRLLSGMGVWDARGTEGTYFFYSTLGPRQGLRGMSFALVEGAGSLIGAIPGPYRVGEDDSAREPFELQIEGNRAMLHVQGRSYALQEGKWSDWIGLEFRLGALRLQKVFVVTRVLLHADGHEVSLYVSPLNFDPARPLFPISCPPEYSRELTGAIGTFHTRGMPFDTQALNDGLLSDSDFLEQWDFVFAEQEEVFAHELKRFDSGLLIAYFDAADALQHTFWCTIDPKHPAYTQELAARHGHAIADCYGRLDAVLGRAMTALGERGTVAVLSDHGFAPFHMAVHLNALLRKLGFLSLRDGSHTSKEFLRDVDWSRTRAYAIGFNSVYLNLAGREGQGSVRQGEAGALLKGIARALEGYRDQRTGSSPIKTVRIASELYPTSRHKDRPDLIVGYRRGYRASWETALGAVPEKVLEQNAKRWSGDHLVDAQEVPGVFLSSDPRLDASSIMEAGPAVTDYYRRVSQ